MRRPAIIRPNKQRGSKFPDKDADDRADSVDQINPVEEQHAANLVCEAADRTREPKAMAKVRMPESSPTCVVSRPKPSCHTVMVDDRPTIIPEPSIEPIPAAKASGMYLPSPSFCFVEAFISLPYC